MSIIPSSIQTPFAYAEELLAVCEDAVAATTSGAIDRVYVSPGRPAYDCEQLTIALVSLGEADTAVATTLARGRRPVTGRVNLLGFLVTVLRDCVPVLEGESPPAPASIAASASEVIEDVWAIWSYLYWAFRRGELLGGACDDLMMDAAIAIETEGTLAGFEIEFRVNIPGILNAGGGT